MKRILTGLVITGIVGTSAILATNSFFSSTQTSTDNSFTAGRLDLKVNSSDNPGAVVTINDLKPGNLDTVNKTLFVDNNPAWVWLHIKDLVATQGAQTDSETAEEAIIGPKSDIQDYLTYTLVINANPVIATASGILLSDAVSCWIPLGQVAGGIDIPAQQIFHFDPAVTNWAQGDVLTFSEDFYATQIRNNPSPTPPDTGSGLTWNTEVNRCAVAGEAADPDVPQLGTIRYVGYPTGYEFWFTPNQGILFYIPGHSYHNTYTLFPGNPAAWCGTTVVPDRAPYNLVGHTGQTVYYKVFDLTANSSVCP